MKKIIIILLMLVVILGAIRFWVNKPSLALVGVWQGISGVGRGDKLIFTEDKFSETNPIMPVLGSYKFINNNEILADYDNTGFGTFSLVMKIKVDAKNLAITSPEGTTQYYIKIPDNSFDDIIRNLLSGNFKELK